MQSTRDPREAMRERILDTFAEGARVDGPRAVVMAELARELGISTRTLYQHFPSKAALVECLLARWADEVEHQQKERLATEDLSPYDLMLRASESWLDGQCRFSPDFWGQLEKDFPETYHRFQARLRAILRVGRDVLIRYVRPDIHEGLALSLMTASLAAASDPVRCERLGLTRKDAVRQAIEAWVRGVLQPVDELHRVQPGH